MPEGPAKFEVPPKSNTQESKESERSLTREEVLKVIGGRIEGYTIERELSDAGGLYLLEARVAGEKSGEITEYRYHRKRESEENSSSSTVIYVNYYEDGIPVGGTTFADYNEKTGTWKSAE